MQRKINKKNFMTILATALAIIAVLIVIKTIPPGKSSQSDLPTPTVPVVDHDREALGGDIDETSFPRIIYDPRNVDLDELITSFDFLRNPLPGTWMSWKDAHLPGAARPYRAGTHYGLDFYPDTSGGGIGLGSTVKAAAPGTVKRIDHDYIPPPAGKLGELAVECQQRGYTPDETLNIFRGRQIWIENEHGFLVYYCHLHEVNDELEVGDYVKTGDIVGKMGFSGTDEPDRPHLHLEIWFGDHYLGEGMTVEQIRTFFESTIFREER
ncbi:MAG: M23 family metallopeptidase [Firmicutes bacterium]|nr:M23 family metallopeptidase [Bacillota bacterium]